MKDETQKRFDELVRMSYAFFSDKQCTPESLRDFIEMLQPTLSKYGIQPDLLYAELERRHTVAIIDSAYILDDSGDHKDWFNPSTNAGLDRDLEWHFWEHFKDYLSLKKNGRRRLLRKSIK